jgi:hypothetical protein
MNQQDFSKMSIEDMMKLANEAKRAIEIVKGAERLKNRSAEVLTRFNDQIKTLTSKKLSGHRETQQSPYGGNPQKVWVFELKGVPRESAMCAPFLRMISDLCNQYEEKPFGLVPMREFWNEWSKAVGDTTELLVNRYMAKYVNPYPTDTVENVEAFKVGEALEDSPPQ